MNRARLILDCDPGIDDAFAILCAIRYASPIAITTVSGNVPVESTTVNALHVLELAGASVPVHAGSRTPLAVTPSFADRVHGASGLGDRPVPEPKASASAVGAVDAIAALLDEAPTPIVATGPLTNIARLLQARPDLVSRIQRLFWMGGSTDTGNTTPKAEFNSWADPHAVAEVMRSGVPMTMFGLNLTRQVRLTREHGTILRAADTPTSVRTAEYLEFYARSRRDGLGQPMHDPCAVLGLTHADLFDVTASHIVVGTADDETRGQTQVWTTANDQATRVDVANQVEADAAIALILSAAIEPQGGES